MQEIIIAALNEAQAFAHRFRSDPQSIESVAQAAQLMLATLKRSGTIFSCGNGGSMSDAMHFAEELSGRYRRNRQALAAMAISDPGHISCVANDFGYEQVFARFLEAHARPRDCLLAISTSGSSANVIEAARFAKNEGMTVITLTGAAPVPLEPFSDVCIFAGSNRFADRIQEMHIKIIHIIIALIENELFPDKLD
jgi:D-sedoheptulose 7-phosphate isomerase